jgi:hypothetical protein
MSYAYSSRTIFILGAPRSGTTWLAKIFDSHPDVIYRHEPDIVCRNDDLPYLCRDDQVREHVREAQEWLNTLARTRRLKSVGTQPIFPKSFNTQSQLLRRRAMIAALRLAQYLPLAKTLVNSIDVPDFVELESDAYKRLVIKSVSGMGRAGLIAAAAPDSRIIVILRDPCGQVESMMRGIRWSMFENDIPVGALIQTRQAKRHKLTFEMLANLSMPAQLAWSWVISNEMALEALKVAKQAKFVRYRDLAQDPTSTTRSLFDFCNLEWRPEVAAFIKRSTQASGRERYYEVKRDPLEALEKWRRQLAPGEIEEICAVAFQSEPGRMFLDEINESASQITNG